MAAFGARGLRMKDYQFVFIDADDTLFDYKVAERIALSKALLQYGIVMDNQILADYSHINKQLWLDYEENKISQDDLRIERFKRLFQKMKSIINAYDFSKAYLNELTESSQVFPDSENVCSYLHNKYKLAIITNGISIVQRTRLQRSSIKQYIDYLIISEEAKCNKPNIGIFDYAETITNYRDKDKMIIIGDSLSSDILGGINYGIDTCWLNQNNINNIQEIKPNYTISSLIDIKKIL